MTLNSAGTTIRNVWEELLQKFPITLHQFTIMPNHVHFIIEIVEGSGSQFFDDCRNVDVRRVGAQFIAPATDRISGVINHAPTPATQTILGHVVRYLKAKSSRLANTSLWQRGYYDRIIRNERELRAIQEYVVNNPLNWSSDTENPFRTNVLKSN